MKTIIAASLLSADFFNLDKEFERMMNSGIDMVHYDVMDGVFVNNISFGIPVLKSLNSKSDMFFDAHLMIVHPEKYIEDFAKAGADMITFHYEAVEEDEIASVIELIHSFGIKAGISVKPKTDEKVLIPYLKDLDNVLVMSVEPGFGGQGFIPESVDKLKNLKNLIEQHNSKAMLQVDGGINDKTCAIAREAGANNLVSGSYLFKAEDMKKAADLLRG